MSAAQPFVPSNSKILTGFENIKEFKPFTPSSEAKFSNTIAFTPFKPSQDKINYTNG
jgi:hypothetical protein